MKAYKRADAVWVYTPEANFDSVWKMNPLQHPDIFHLEAARGWLELGNSLEAESELGRISGRNREHPEVLEVMWQISSRRLEWERCAELAAKVIKGAPALINGYIHKAYALHELKRTQEAWDVLFPVAEKFP